MDRQEAEISKGVGAIFFTIKRDGTKEMAFCFHTTEEGALMSLEKRQSSLLPVILSLFGTEYSHPDFLCESLK